MLDWMGDIGAMFSIISVIVSFAAGLYNTLVYSIEVVRSNFKIRPKNNEYGI